MASSPTAPDTRRGRPPRPARPARPLDAGGWLRRHPVAAVAAAVVLLRLPGVAAAPGIDESGFLMVARQWRAGGSSLYGDYWVDRPPLLITIYRLAGSLGGLVPLRLLGCLAAVLVVAGVAHAARSWAEGAAAGRAAAGWAAAVAGACCASPVLGSTEVNGELLAAPFVAWGIAAGLAAVGRPPGRERDAWALAAGAALAGAVLVKQNFVDVGVFLVVLLAGSCWTRRVPVRAGVRVALSAGLGGVGTLVVAALWTVAHGTSLTDLYRALYPFRLAAARVLAAGDGSAVDERRWALVERVLVSGAPVLLVVVVVALLRRRLGGPATYAVLAVLVFDLASIWAGGSYWSHYLVQLIVPLSLLVGALVARGVAGGRAVATLVLVVAACGWLVVLPSAATPGSEATALGDAVGRAARPTDTLVTVYGHSDVTEASGLSSPYPHLWSLPLKTLDPQLTELDGLLASPRRPTWLVTWGSLRTWGVDSAHAERLVARYYRPVAVLGGHTVYLADGVARPVPELRPLRLGGR